MKVDGSGGAEFRAHAAALTGQGVDAERAVFFPDGIEPAAPFTGAAVLAAVLPDGGFGAADEIFGLYRFRPENDVPVRHVDVEIADDGVLREMGKRSAEARFAGASLAADNGDFTHGAAP